jgi:hypothetical protein
LAVVGDVGRIQHKLSFFGVAVYFMSIIDSVGCV